MYRLLKKLILKPIWCYEIFVLNQIPIWLYFSIKARSLTFFSALNPDINLGGLLNYSKYLVTEKMEKKYLPITILLKSSQDNESLVENLIFEKKMSFPIILKPDIGERGMGVLKIMDIETLKAKILLNKNIDLILQEYIPYPMEIGILYQRNPNEDKGTISSFAIKEYAFIRGNEKSSIQELIKKRGISLSKIDQSGFDVNHILKNNEELILNEIGNKCFGARFKNANHLINQQLVELFDKISKQIPNFYFGRYDIKIESIERLYQGEGMKILELNGANSQPIHMFDESISAFRTYCIIWNNWKNIYNISKENNRNGIPYISFREFYNQAINHYKIRRIKS